MSQGVTPLEKAKSDSQASESGRDRALGWGSVCEEMRHNTEGVVTTFLRCFAPFAAILFLRRLYELDCC